MRIYKIIDPTNNETVYIGKTGEHLLTRLARHIVDIQRKRKYATDKAEWFKAMVDLNIMPKIVEIESCTDEIASAREKYWIETVKPKLNSVYTDNPNMKSLSKRISDVKSKIVYQYDKNGEFIRSWKSITSAANELYIDGTNISSAAIGKRKLGGEFMWRYKKYSRIDPYLAARSTKEVHQYDYEGNYLNSFNSAREVPNANYKLISKCCNGNLFSANRLRYSFKKMAKLVH